MFQNLPVARAPPLPFFRSVLLLISFAAVTLIVTMAVFGVTNYDASVMFQKILSNQTHFGEFLSRIKTFEGKNVSKFEAKVDSSSKFQSNLNGVSKQELISPKHTNQSNAISIIPQEKHMLKINSKPGILNDARCEMKTKVVFAKTHKTGSSTVQNILFRFGVSHNLTFSLPPKGWMFSFKEPFHSKIVLQGQFARLKTFDIFAFHSVWNYKEVKKVIPKGTFLTILRDPVDTFESNYVYMGLANSYKMDINQFAKKKAKEGLTRRPGAISGKNQLLWDLGMSSKSMEDPKSVNQMIMQTESQFNLVMIAEKFEESLILLGEIMCWPLEELTYLRQNERLDASKSNITAEAKNLLTHWLWADYLLYEHFVKRLEDKIETYGRERMRLKVEELRVLNEKLEKECVKAKGGNDMLKGEFKMASKIVQGYVVDDGRPWCEPFALSEPSFAKRIRQRQLKMMRQANPRPGVKAQVSSGGRADDGIG